MTDLLPGSFTLATATFDKVWEASVASVDATRLLHKRRHCHMALWRQALLEDLLLIAEYTPTNATMNIYMQIYRNLECIRLPLMLLVVIRISCLS